MQQVFTIGQLLHLIERSYKNPKTLNTFVDNHWTTTSTSEMLEEVKFLALGLLALGVQPKEKVGIIALPCSRWTIADLAIMAIGAISVPLFANISDDNFMFEIKQSGLKTTFVWGTDQWKRCDEHSNLFTRLISLDNQIPAQKAIAFQEVIERGKDQDKLNPNLFKELLDRINPEDVATIIYTSGSTGVPKGAVHTHHALTSLLHTEMFDWQTKSDSFLSILPLAHVFARVVNFIMVAWGISIYYYNDIKNVSVACQEIHPTLMIVVPRLLEKVYGKMVSRVQAANPLKRCIGNWAFHLANQTQLSWWQKITLPLANLLVYKNLRAALGGKFRVILSGGAALNPQLNLFFINVGIPVFEGWGLTEACPVTVNAVGRQKIGAVGKPIPGMYVKLGPENELLVYGEMVMKEYYLDEEITKKTFTSDGGLKTGDNGTIDEEGFVTIIGRQKELFKTSTGEMIAPTPIEQALSKIPFIDFALVIADNRKFASTLLVPDLEGLRALKKKKNLSQLSDEEFLQTPIMQEEVENYLTQVNEHLNNWEKIRRFRFIPHQLSIESGELTPSMKVRRNVIENRYKDLIDAMYKEDTDE